ESGSVALTYSKAQCKGLTDRLIAESGAVHMDDLMALSEEKLKSLNEALNEYINFPQRDGKLIPLNPYREYIAGKTRNVDMLIGTNAHEANYWIGEVGGIVPFRFSVPVKFENDLRIIQWEDRRRVNEFMRTRKGSKIWRMSKFYTEVMFRLPAVLQAAEHSANGGKAYMYYWKVRSAIPYYRACHAIELAYVFGNTDETIFTGKPVDPGYSKMVQQMWVNFATCGDPGLPELNWPAYDKKKRSTMMFTKKPYVEDDPRSSSRKLLYPLLKYSINPNYSDLDLNTHFIRRVIGIGALLSAGVTVGLAALIVALIRKLK
ncbi:MAG: carboxylesterase family protein, partial [Parasporobacterium sp.]|nr:carboxylesterase family protein [Parasporobacterium sp.]